jgi:glycosyltransferase involved in cell wall biosynthesis
VITTLPYQVNVFLKEHALALRDDAELTVINNGGAEELHPELQGWVRHHKVMIERPIRPWADLCALIQIGRILMTEQPDIVQTMTPKAGLLGMLAAFGCRTPIRVHWFTGQVWVAKRGPLRFALRTCDRLVAWLSTSALVDSPSQRDFLVQEHIAPLDGLKVLGKGSVRGVDTRRFRPDSEARRSVRRELGLSERDTVALFVGRLTNDKGLLELVTALRELHVELPHLHVALVGFEEGDFVQTLLHEVGSARDRLHILGFSQSPERYCAAADFLVLPSYREGFGSTIIEAAACGIPAIGTRIYGLTDAIVDGSTGLLVAPRETSQLVAALRLLASDHQLRARMGEAARARALRDFETTALTAALREHYSDLLCVVNP